ncbi:MAG: hydantoinase/oxoprolinase family protein [Methanobacteriota archaeon]|nr:MAG: hydantoinase/oxoprolinase family protein [Euryarchaeota archaeon]
MDVGVDVGGTFTDFVGFRGREVVTAKVPSTPDPSRAVVDGMRELGAGDMAHGTTVATNAILQRKGARTVFVTTAGFEDLLVIGRQDRPNLYDFHVTRASPPVDSEMCLGADERVDARGRPLRPLTEREARRIAREVRSRKAESVAICLLFSFMRPSHERILRDALGDLPVSMSHEVLPEFREYERASTTVLDAYLKPLVGRYLTELRAAIRKDFFVMKSGGGVAVHSAVARRPVDLVLSGPAGGVAAGAALSRGSHSRNFVTFDMGGTSADFSALPKGEPTWTTDAVIDTFPIAIPVIDIESVGAGGGSLAWIDPGGALRVGPESAGATPGPMAYGAGGSQVTVTDADLVGGSLGPSLLGGRLPLDRSLSTKGIEALASTLHLSRDEAILGVQRVVEASMAKAMRLVLARRGLDPRDFALLAFGGAGPMHACALAQQLGVRTVLVPFLPGAFSAYGILISPIRAEYGRSVLRPLERAETVIESAIEEFRDRAISVLRTQGHDVGRAQFESSVDLRFKGQSYEINVPIRGDLRRAFHRAHRLRYGYASRSEAIEVVAARLVVRMPRPFRRPRAPLHRGSRPRSRRVLFDDGWHDVPVHERSRLGVGSEIDGPAIVAEDHATTVVPPGAHLTVDRLGLLEVEVPR